MWRDFIETPVNNHKGVWWWNVTPNGKKIAKVAGSLQARRSSHVPSET